MSNLDNFIAAYKRHRLAVETNNPLLWTYGAPGPKPEDYNLGELAGWALAQAEKAAQSDAERRAKPL